MHIHMYSATSGQPAGCTATGSDLLVSVDTISEFTGMDAAMTETWLEQLAITPHECEETRYVPCHRIMKFLTNENRPAMEHRDAVAMLTAKLAPHVGNAVEQDTNPEEIMGAVRDAIVIDARRHGHAGYHNERYMVTFAMAGLRAG